MNKNNLIKVLIVSIVFIILIAPLIHSVFEEGAGVVSTADVETALEFEVIDGKVNLKDVSGELVIDGTEGIDTLELASGVIPNIKSGNLVLKDGRPESGKLYFSDLTSFNFDNQFITVPKDGYIEFKDGKLIVSKDTTIELEGTKIQAMIDETEIKIEKDIVEVKGIISVDYKLSPDKIILIGEDSSVEIQTDEDEKFEFKNLDGKELIVNIGSFHKSEDCLEKNCISYQDMGIGMSGEEWNKLKIDGNALITKYYNEEKIYEINFEDGEAKLSRDLSKLKDTEFNQKTVINYNSGDITLFIEKSEERAKEIDQGRINIGKGIINEEFYDDKDIQLTIGSEAILEEPIQEQIYPEADSELKEKASGIDVDGKTLYDIVKEKGEDIMTENLILAWIDQESSMDQDAELGGSVGFTQASAISFRDVINRNPEKYKKYLSYTNEELTEALKDDALLNLEVGFDYMKSLKITYGFSQEKIESNYKYTGSEEDILLMAYNAGPTVTKDILTEFKNTGGGDWDELEDFLHTDEALNIFKKYKKSYGVKDDDTPEQVNSKLERKINIVINYVKNIKKNAGYT